MSSQYPPIEPYDSGTLDAGDGRQLYWDCRGNPEGKRRFFDPDPAVIGCSR